MGEEAVVLFVKRASWGAKGRIWRGKGEKERNWRG